MSDFIKEFNDLVERGDLAIIGQKNEAGEIVYDNPYVLFSYEFFGRFVSLKDEDFVKCMSWWQKLLTWLLRISPATECTLRLLDNVRLFVNVMGKADPKEPFSIADDAVLEFAVLEPRKEDGEMVTELAFVGKHDKVGHSWEFKAVK